jgi:uncharacterized membrane protein
MLIPAPHETFALGFLASVVEWLKLVVEAGGAVVIVVGVVAAARRALRSARSGDGVDFAATRLVLARYLALALELQLGADILSTAIAPSWDQIGKLGAIAVIRTFLNFFLRQEMKGETPEAKA